MIARSSWKAASDANARRRWLSKSRTSCSSSRVADDRTRPTCARKIPAREIAAGCRLARRLRSTSRPARRPSARRSCGWFLRSPAKPPSPADRFRAGRIAARRSRFHKWSRSARLRKRSGPGNRRRSDRLRRRQWARAPGACRNRRRDPRFRRASARNRQAKQILRRTGLARARRAPSSARAARQRNRDGSR